MCAPGLFQGCQGSCVGIIRSWDGEPSESRTVPTVGESQHGPRLWSTACHPQWDLGGAVPGSTNGSMSGHSRCRLPTPMSMLLSPQLQALQVRDPGAQGGPVSPGRAARNTTELPKSSRWAGGHLVGGGGPRPAGGGAAFNPAPEEAGPDRQEVGLLSTPPQCDHQGQTPQGRRLGSVRTHWPECPKRGILVNGENLPSLTCLWVLPRRPGAGSG